MKNVGVKLKPPDCIFFSDHIEQLELSRWQVVLAILSAPIRS